MTIVTWTGKSGQRYEFELYPTGMEFKPVSGVYIFCRNKISGVEALYVGETQSFYDRLNANIENHDGFKRASQIGATHIAVMVAGNLPNRLRIETDLRHGLNPVCNRQPVGSLIGKRHR